MFKVIPTPGMSVQTTAEANPDRIYQQRRALFAYYPCGEMLCMDLRWLLGNNAKFKEIDAALLYSLPKFLVEAHWGSSHGFKPTSIPKHTAELFSVPLSEIRKKFNPPFEKFKDIRDVFFDHLAFLIGTCIVSIQDIVMGELLNLDRAMFPDLARSFFDTWKNELQLLKEFLIKLNTDSSCIVNSMTKETGSFVNCGNSYLSGICTEDEVNKIQDSVILLHYKRKVECVKVYTQKRHYYVGLPDPSKQSEVQAKLDSIVSSLEARSEKIKKSSVRHSRTRTNLTSTRLPMILDADDERTPTNTPGKH